MSELWDNPLYSAEDRLEMAKGGILFRDKVIETLRRRLESLDPVQRPKNDRSYAERRLDELASIMQPAVERIVANPKRYDAEDEGIDLMAVIAHEFVKSDGLPQWNRHDLYRHKKTGGMYRVLCWSQNESEPEMALTTYQCVDDGKVWTRPKTEFEDGRFVRVYVKD